MAVLSPNPIPHLLTASPPHRLTASPPHRLTASPPHRLTASPPHRLTASPPHRLTASPPHRLTASPPHLHVFLSLLANFYCSLSGNGDTEIGVAVTSREFSTKLVTQLLSEHTGVARAEITNISAFMKGKPSSFISFLLHPLPLFLTSLLDRMDSIAASNASCFSKVYPAHRAKSTMEYVYHPFLFSISLHHVCCHETHIAFQPENI